MDLAGKRVLVTGGSGFLGRPVCRRIEERGAAAVVVPRRRDYDLTTPDAVRRLLEGARPDVVIHLAAEVGGIGANRVSPGRFFYANLAMGMNLIEEARQRGVPKFVQVGTVCSYPKLTPIPFREEDLWQGYPEETNAPYGLAKKALLVMLQAYRQQYGMNGVYVVPVNLYGPGDNFDPATSHVIPALIRKCETAREQGSRRVVCWGTGNATREFLYVEDCAEAIVLATERYDGAEPINLGSGQEISVADLARLIAEVTSFDGELDWDPSHPDGQPRRLADSSRAREELGFEASVALPEGLRRTVAWYRERSAVPSGAVG
ncbi:MAG TPA: GDP-L-fucose synthase [Solirubrobacteraceae bacterium]|nr:GDP-L-fucose synthase [Solirubrobacteraceae bacterium]